MNCWWCNFSKHLTQNHLAATITNSFQYLLQLIQYVSNFPCIMLIEGCSNKMKSSLRSELALNGRIWKELMIATPQEKNKSKHTCTNDDVSVLQLLSSINIDHLLFLLSSINIDHLLFLCDRQS